MMHYAVKCILAPEIAAERRLQPAGETDRARRHGAQSAPARRRLGAPSDAAGAGRLRAEGAWRRWRPAAPPPAARSAFPTFCAGGFDDRPEKRNGSNGGQPYYVISDIIGGGMGGHRKRRRHGCGRYPWRQLRDALGRGDGDALALPRHALGTGARLRRRRPASRRPRHLSATTSTCRSAASSAAMCSRRAPDTAPWGLAGGGPGGKAAMQLNPGKPNEKRLKSKVIGEVLRERRRAAPRRRRRRGLGRPKETGRRTRETRPG